MLLMFQPNIIPPSQIIFSAMFNGACNPLSGTFTDPVTGAIYRQAYNGGACTFYQTPRTPTNKGMVSKVVYKDAHTYRGELELLNFIRPKTQAAPTWVFFEADVMLPTWGMLPSGNYAQDVLLQMHATATVPWQFNHSPSIITPGTYDMTMVVSAPNPQSVTIGPAATLQPLDQWVRWAFALKMSTVKTKCEMQVWRDGTHVFSLLGSEFTKPFLISGGTNEDPKLKAGIYWWRAAQAPPPGGVGTVRAACHDRIVQYASLPAYLI